MAKTIQQVFSKKPDWVSREISDKEVHCVVKELKLSNCIRGLEIGSASGYSAACIYSQLSANNEKNAILQCYDLSKKCYYDSNYNTGDAAFSIHGKGAKITFNTGVTSADLPEPSPDQEKFDFLFIDANHRNPWAAFDLLSLGRYLKPDALIALDDVNMVYNPKFRDCNGGRDLYRTWRGNKWRYKGCSNIGFLRMAEPELLINSVEAALMNDWDAKVESDYLEKFILISNYYGMHCGHQIENAINNGRHFQRSLKKLNL